jgi:hypothetical protein
MAVRSAGVGVDAEGVEGADVDAGVDETPRISERAVEDVPARRFAARKRARCLGDRVRG